jgi:glycerol-3-phosphate dehydrogenase (NAD(P)+)
MGKIMAKTTVIGDGGWGTALAMVLQQNGHDVTVWGPFDENIRAVRDAGMNSTYLPGVALPAGIRWTTDTHEATRDASVVVMAVPTQFYRDVAARFKGLISPSAQVVSVTKGLDRETHRTMTEIACECLGIPCAAALSGPSHAEEVARGIPTAVVVASPREHVSTYLQSVFNNSRLRVYTADDVTGVQIGGALKNVIAIAVGISDGLGFGDNTRAALITRGLSEISRLGAALGCRPETFAGLSGMGDLIVTCTSRHSRNRGVGERLGRGETLAQITGGMKQVAEGVWNAANAKALAAEHGVDVPITEQVCRILYEGASPLQAVEALMSRDVKPEQPLTP